MAIQATLVFYGLRSWLWVLLLSMTVDAAGKTIGKDCDERICKKIGNGKMTLWHATDKKGACGIKDCGFAPGGGGKVGAGIYFAETRAVALEKTKYKENDQMFQVKVNLGCVLEVSEADSFSKWQPRDIQANKAELERLKCDSIKLSYPGDGVEYVVYDAKHIEAIHDISTGAEKCKCTIGK